MNRSPSFNQSGGAQLVQLLPDASITWISLPIACEPAEAKYLSRCESRIGVESRHKVIDPAAMLHNKALQLTASPLCGLSAAELGR